MLDTSREYSPVYGSSRAAFFQVQSGRGRYFDADHNEVPEEVAAQPAPAEVDEIAALPEVHFATVQKATQDLSPGPCVPPAPESREAVLRAMHGTRIAQLVMDAGGTPATGNGSKATNVAWLLANTD